MERGMASVAALCLLPTAATRTVAVRTSAVAAAEPYQADLQLPPTPVPVSTTATEERCELTIRARKGRTTVVNVTNGLSYQQNVHLHGGLVPAASDGHPMQLIEPGGSFTYTYPNVQDAATLWYHDHAHGLSARTMFYGLAGF